MIEFRDIILIILTIIVIFLLYKNMNKENFAQSQTDINQMIASTYQVDLDAMRNLGQIANNILTNNDTLNIPANNIIIPGNLEVGGNVTFINKNINMMEIFPQYMVISWASATIPKGWATCDGNTYILRDDGNAVQDSTGIRTPDLRGRFVLGSGQGVGLTNRNLNDPPGGEETVTLKDTNIPSHSHNMFNKTIQKINNSTIFNAGVYQESDNSAKDLIVLAGGDEGDSNSYLLHGSFTYPYPVDGGSGGWFGKTREWGGALGGGTTESIDNMPPYYILTYIMKL